MGESEWVRLKCPYCEVEQVYNLERTTRPQVVLCDCEDVPGCDRYFAVELEMVPRVKYYALDDIDNTIRVSVSTKED